MKCVCPMGGNRTCPDDCPLAVWADMPAADRKAQRKPIAEKLYRQGFTEQQIATQLGVNVATISRDLSEFLHDAKTQPRTSKRGRKGEGRPKGKRSSSPGRGRKPGAEKITPAQEHIIGKAVLDEGKTYAQAAEEAGLDINPSHHGDLNLRFAVAREEGRRDQAVQRTDLSMTAQEKFDAAVKAHKRKLDAEFETRVLAECKRRLDEISLPHYAKQLADLERLISSRKGIMDRLTYRKILACLHPDRVADPALKKRYEEAFRLFTELEKCVLDEKESPTPFRKMPRTYEDLMAMRAKVQADNRAKRARKSGSLNLR